MESLVLTSTVSKIHAIYFEQTVNILKNRQLSPKTGAR